MRDKLILDTETTGLGEDAEIIEICIIDNQGNIRINERIKPVYSVPPEVVKIHGISDHHLANSPTWEEIYPNVMDVLDQQIVYAYKSDFDFRMIKQTTALYPELCDLIMNVEQLFDIRCAMKMAQKKLGLCENMHLPLSKACELLEIDFDESKNHSALYDCQKTLEIINVCD